MMGRMRRLASRVGLVAVLTLSGCASWFMKGEAPEVLVTNVTPLDASAFEQRLQVDLRIRNPNDFDLAVTGIDFRLDLKELVEVLVLMGLLWLQTHFRI